MAALDWNAVLQRLQTSLHTQQFETWFKALTLKGIDAQGIIVEAPSVFARDWIARNYLGVLRTAIGSVTGESEPAVRLVTPAGQPTIAGTEPMRQGAGSGDLSDHLSPDYTFDNFIVGPANRLPHAAALAVVENPGRSYNPLFLHGPVGLGKTHLIQAVCHALVARADPLKILYLSCEAFVNDYIRTIKDGDWEAFRYRYRTVDVLLVDDVQFLGSSEHTQEEFFHTFNSLYHAQRQIVVTSDCAPQDMPKIQERLVSRFKWGLVARIEPPAYETRVAIIQRKAAMQGVQLPEDVVQLLAASITTNIRELQGAITRVTAQARLAASEPTLQVAREALRDSLPDQKPISIDDIITLVCERFAVRVPDLQSRKKSKSIVFPRHICMYLARMHTKHSLEEIGGYFGGRDHTTVLHADEKIKRDREEDQSLRRLLHRLSAELEAAR